MLSVFSRVYPVRCAHLHFLKGVRRKRRSAVDHKSPTLQPTSQVLRSLRK